MRSDAELPLSSTLADRVYEAVPVSVTVGVAGALLSVLAATMVVSAVDELAGRDDASDLAEPGAAPEDPEMDAHPERSEPAERSAG